MFMDMVMHSLHNMLYFGNHLNSFQRNNKYLGFGINQ